MKRIAAAALAILPALAGITGDDYRNAAAFVDGRSNGVTSLYRPRRLETVNPSRPIVTLNFRYRFKSRVTGTRQEMR